MTPLFSFQRDPLFRLKLTPWSWKRNLKQNAGWGGFSSLQPAFLVSMKGRVSGGQLGPEWGGPFTTDSPWCVGSNCKNTKEFFVIQGYSEGDTYHIDNLVLDSIFKLNTLRPEAWQMRHRLLEKCGQNVSNFGESHIKDLVICLKISNLQGLSFASGGCCHIGGCWYSSRVHRWLINIVSLKELSLRWMYLNQSPENVSECVHKMVTFESSINRNSY